MEKQLQHERRRQQVRLRLPGSTRLLQATQQGQDQEAQGAACLTPSSYFPQQSAPQVAING